MGTGNTPRLLSAGMFSSLIASDPAPTAVDVVNPASCVNCGCTDRRACPGGCYWLSVSRVSGTGLCSSCVE